MARVQNCSRRNRHGAFVIVIATLLLALTAVEAAAADDDSGQKHRTCGHPGVRITYRDAAELDAACTALADTTKHFHSFGFAAAPRFLLRFADRDINLSSKLGSVHGYFDVTRLTGVIYRTSSAQPWGQPWSAELASSFVRHEPTHILIWLNISDQPTQLRPEWHEFIAYAVQFHLMSGELRSAILAKNTEVRPFEDLMQVNEFTSRMDPERFAIAAYKTYLAKGGTQFVAQLIRGKIVPPPFAYSFAVLPGQIPAQ